MKDDDRFKYSIGCKVMGVLNGILIAGKIIKRNIHGCHERTLMYTINNIDDSDNTAWEIIMEEKKIVPYNALKWKEATVIWNEANNLIKKGKLAKNLAAGLIMNNYGEEYER